MPDRSAELTDLRSAIANAAGIRFRAGALKVEAQSIRVDAEAGGVDAGVVDSLRDLEEDATAAADAMSAHVEALEAEAAELSNRPKGSAEAAVDSVLEQRYARPSERREK